MGVPERAPARRFRTAGERAAHIADLERQMKQAAADLDFEKAAALRDELRALRVADLGLAAATVER
jgi:excinuclease ABC subunit B